jgi:hypothetical protein
MEIKRFSEDPPYPNSSLQIAALRTTDFLDPDFLDAMKQGLASSSPSLRSRPAFIFYHPRLNLRVNAGFRMKEKRYKDAARVALSL